jgi:hypothetical protein
MSTEAVILFPNSLARALDPVGEGLLSARHAYARGTEPPFSAETLAGELD